MRTSIHADSPAVDVCTFRLVSRIDFRNIRKSLWYQFLNTRHRLWRRDVRSRQHAIRWLNVCTSASDLWMVGFTWGSWFTKIHNQFYVFAERRKQMRVHYLIANLDAARKTKWLVRTRIRAMQLKKEHTYLAGSWRPNKRVFPWNIAQFFTSKYRKYTSERRK